MKAIYGYDPAKWRLGRLCKHGHAWPGTEQSLRRIGKIPACAGCSTSSSYWLAGFIVGIEGGVLPPGTKLGKPCRKHGHTWEDTGWGLRKHNHCVICHPLQKRLDPHERRRRELARKRYYDHVRRSRRYGVQLVNASASEVRERFQQFGNRCAYCGSSGPLHIEHFLPISKGGGHVLSNIIPACQPCNLAKQGHDPETWYKAQPFFTERRWRIILRALGKQRAPVGQLSLV